MSTLLTHIKPQFTYCGLTIVLSNPSRLDKLRGKLLCGGALELVTEFLQPEYNTHMCDIRSKECLESLLPETKAILLCGEPATKLWLNQQENTIGELRGSPFIYDGRFSKQQLNIVCIPTFFPQDAADRKNYEREFNPQEELSVIDSGQDDDDDPDAGVDAKRRHGRTKQKNYRFWLQQDINKCKYLLKNNGKVPSPPFQSQYKISPSSHELIEILQNTKGKHLFFDLETFYPSCDLQCIGFSFNYGHAIYVFPVYSFNREWAYPNLHNILRAFSVAMRDNTAVAYNGSGFDYLVLADKYHISIGKKVEDPMIMFHRLYSDVEKSLGHTISCMTWQQFHKDEGDEGYHTPQQMQKKMIYCGKDVYGMQLVHYGLMEKCKTLPGLSGSFREANEAIRPYMTCMLQGIHYKQKLLREIMNDNDRMMMQFLRMLALLVGEKSLKTIQGKSKSGMPSSNVQCCRYFHDMLGYPIAGYGKEREDGTKGASLGKKNMLKLKLKNPLNPVIDLVLAYREYARESGSLKFIPWKQTPEMIEQTREKQMQLKV